MKIKIILQIIMNKVKWDFYLNKIKGVRIENKFKLDICLKILIIKTKIKLKIRKKYCHLYKLKET